MDGNCRGIAGGIWASRISCAEYVGIPKSWRQYFNEPEEGRCWLEMEPDGEGYRGISKGMNFHYHKDMGLEKEK